MTTWIAPAHRFVPTRGIILATLAAALLSGCGSKPPSPVAAERDMPSVTQAVFAEDRLWLLHQNGSLASLAPDDARAVPVAATGGIAAICRSAGRLNAIVDDGRGGATLQQRSSGRWIVRASASIDGDTLVALGCADDDQRITLVTDRRLLELDGGALRSTTLRQQIRSPLVMATALATGDAIWIGFNNGEWGGGLTRIARRDGSVETVERNISGALCGGPLNTGCDPVNGIAAAPWDPACIVATIGLVHLAPTGRIVEVCGEEVQRLYFKPLDQQPPGATLAQGEPPDTVAFFGLARRGDTLWAVGIDGVYRFSGRQAPEIRPLPKFQDKGGYRASFDLPGVALVMTDVNQRASVSGTVPIMALR